MDAQSRSKKCSEEVKPLPKRIIICCDGTWQSSVSGEKHVPSNVTRLCRHLASAGVDKDGQEWQQIVYYDSGVGTGALLDLEKKRQGANGDGLAINVLEAYNFIVLNYTPADEIFCFGFSRGAYTARAVAGMVTDIGVCEPRELSTFPEVYAIYKENTTGMPFRKTDRWKKFVKGKEAVGSPHDPNASKKWDVAITPGSRKVKAVGVWDTVGALGVPDLRGWNLSYFRREHGFHNVHLNKHIENAFHALALDERRTAFTPAVWCLPPKSSEVKRDGAGATDGYDSDEDLKNTPDPHLLQVWFPGVHINIGGGSTDSLNGKQGDVEEIANITFAWMVEQVSPFLAFGRPSFKQATLEREQLLTAIEQERVEASRTQQALRAVQGWMGSTPPELPLRKVHRGWATGPINPEEGISAFFGAEKRSPLTTAGTTNEQIHPTVAYRAQTGSGGVKYEPEALVGWTRRECKTGPGFEYVKGDSVMPEYKIEWKTDHPNLERLAVHKDAESFLKKVDRINFSLKDEDFEQAGRN